MLEKCIYSICLFSCTSIQRFILKACYVDYCTFIHPHQFQQFPSFYHIQHTFISIHITNFLRFNAHYLMRCAIPIFTMLWFWHNTVMYTCPGQSNSLGISNVFVITNLVATPQALHFQNSLNDHICSILCHIFLLSILYK